MITIGKRFTFEASHKLPGHPTCGVLHGHSYTLIVCVTAAVDLSTGMVQDYKTLSAIVEDVIIKVLDHTHLNDTLEMPTAENLVLWCVRRLQTTDLPLTEVTIQETQNTFAMWRRP